MEGWVNLGGGQYTEVAQGEPATSWSQVQRSNHYATKPLHNVYEKLTVGFIPRQIS